MISRFSTKLFQVHYKLFKGITKYSLQTKHWGTKYYYSIVKDNLDPVTLVADVILDKTLPPFSVDINQPNQWLLLMLVLTLLFAAVVQLYTVPKHSSSPLLLVLLM